MAEFRPVMELTRASRILIVEDEPIVARNLERMLHAAGHRVAHIAMNAAEANRWLESHTPDLAIVDIALPEGRLAGLEVATRIATSGRTGLIFVSGHADRATLSRARLTGAWGWIVKPFSETQLTTAVEFALARAGEPNAAEASTDHLARGVQAIERRLEELTRRLAEAGVAPSSGASPETMQRVEVVQQLSSREKAVLKALLSNKRVPQIAEQLFISPHTVRSHLKALFRKLGVHSQVELIARFSDDQPRG